MWGASHRLQQKQNIISTSKSFSLQSIYRTRTNTDFSWAPSKHLPQPQNKHLRIQTCFSCNHSTTLVPNPSILHPYSKHLPQPQTKHLHIQNCSSYSQPPIPSQSRLFFGLNLSIFSSHKPSICTHPSTHLNCFFGTKSIHHTSPFFLSLAIGIYYSNERFGIVASLPWHLLD